MSKIADIRAGLGKNLRDNVPGLRVSETIPDSPSPPIAIIGLDNVQYDQTFQRGMSEYNFTISVLAGRVSERNAQARLDSYIDPGTQTIKNAVESDKSLDGAVFDVRVTEMSNIGAVNLGETIYLGADFSVVVYAL
jgi:hypothetical protein